jgi:membrane peptidoglycan carboxypeptidase
MENERKEQDELPPEEADRRRDDTLRNMLRAKPKPHEEMKRAVSKKKNSRPRQENGP